jgi:surfactin synthase thioesterase subunit
MDIIRPAWTAAPHAAARPASPPSGAWLVPLNTVVRPTGVVVCLAFGGGSSAAYRPWAARFPADVQMYGIDLPGRAARYHEPLLTRMEAITQALAGVPDFEAPAVFFGHSLGALLAYEWAQGLAEARRRQPVRLVVSGRSAPQAPSERAPIHRLPDDAFLEEVKRYQGLPEDVLAHRELVELVLPVLRADFTLTETYRFRARAPLAIPITVCCGSSDPMVDPERWLDWQRCTTASCERRLYEGGHFYLHDHRDALIGMLTGYARQRCA